MGYSPWGRKESDTTERLHFTSLLSYQSEESFSPLLNNLTSRTLILLLISCSASLYKILLGA